MRKIGFFVGIFGVLLAGCGKVEVDKNPPVVDFVSPVANATYSASEGVPIKVNMSDNLNLKYFSLRFFKNNGNVYMTDSITLTGQEYQYNKTYESKYIGNDSSYMFVLITVCDNTDNKTTLQRPILMTK